MDLLSRLLYELRISSTTISKWIFHSGFGVHVQGFAPGYLLSVVSGEPLVIQHAQGRFTIAAGEAVLAIRGGDCRIGSNSATTFFALDELPWQGYQGQSYSLDEPSAAVKVRVGDAGDQQLPTVVGGFAFVLRGSVASLSQQLPEFIHLQRAMEQQLMLNAIDFLINDKQPGCLAAAVQLAEFTVTNALRSYLLQQHSFPVGVLRGLSDERIGKVIQFINDQYAKPTNLDNLATIAGMSRSAFADKFAANIGTTPIHYLNQVRVQKAVDLLTQTHLKVDEIAQRCGFGSDRTMRFAFKRAIGKTPKEFRSK